jgi:PAS domain S-box-containing protein
MDYSDGSRNELIRELKELRRQVEHLKKSRTCQWDGADEELPGHRSAAEALLNATTDFVFLVDPQGDFLVLNQRTADFYGESIEQLIGKSSLDIFPSDVAALRKSKLDTVFRKGARVHFEDRHPGMILAHSVYPVIGSNGDVEAAAAYITDITEQKRLEAGLRKSADDLEKRVAERTTELKATVERLAQEISQRAGAQEALKAEKRRFQALVENSPFGIVLVGNTGSVDYVNPWFTEVIGYSTEDKPTWESRFISAFPDSVRKEGEGAPWIEHSERAAPGRTISRTTMIRCKDGKDRAMTLHQVVVDESHSLIAIEDVSEQKKWEEDHRESKETIEALINAVTDCLFLLDSDGTILLANRAATDGWGMPKEIVLGSSLFDLLPSEVSADRKKHLDEVIRTGQVVRFQDEYAGRVFENSLWPAHETGEKVLSVAAYVRDITDRSLAEQAVRSAEERYRRLVELTPYGIGIGSEGKAVFANRALAKLVGADDPQVIIGTSILEFVHPDYRNVVGGRLSKVLHSGEAVPTKEEKLIRMDGTVIDVEITAMPFTYQGKPAVQAVFNDVTQRKQTEKKIKASLAEKEVLLREIHHRVKNNLQIMSSLLRLQARHVKDIGCTEILRGAENRVRSMALIHEKLYQSDSLANLDFGRYVEGLVSFIVTSYGISKNRIKVLIDVNDVSFGVDTAGPLGFIITELISNCLEHAFGTNEQGEIRISLEQQARREYQLVVQDNGVGIPEGVNLEMPQSLGLDLVRSFVQQLRGTAQFRADRGTEVLVRFRDARREKNP